MKTNQEFFDIIEEHMGYIQMLYDKFADKRPVMELSMPKGRICAYPYSEYMKDLSPRSQKILRKEYREAVKTNRMVVFVRDHTDRTMKSASFPIEPPTVVAEVLEPKPVSVAESPFAVCVNNEGCTASLVVGKLYRIIPDDEGERHGCLRVVNESGDVGVYSCEHFFPLEIPPKLKEVLCKATSGKARRRRSTRGKASPGRRHSR